MTSKNNSSLIPLESFDVFGGVPATTEIPQKPVLTPLESVNVWNKPVVEQPFQKTDTAPSVQWDREYTDGDKFEVAMAGQVKHKDRISPSEPTKEWPASRAVDVNEIPAEQAVQQLIKDQSDKDHAVALAEQIKGQEGGEVPEPEVEEIPEPIAVPQPIIEGTISGMKEAVAEEPKPNDIHSDESQLEAIERERLNSYPLYYEDGRVITIMSGQRWKDQESKTHTISLIELSNNKEALRIGFDGRHGEVITIDELKDTFKNWELQGDGMHELERAKIGEVLTHKTSEPGNALGVAYKDGEIVPEKSHIPEIPVEEVDVVAPEEVVPAKVKKAEDQITQVFDEADPAIKAADVAETAGEGDTETIKGQELTTTQAELYRSAVASGPADSANTGFATGLEEQRDRIQDGGETPEVE